MTTISSQLTNEYGEQFEIRADPGKAQIRGEAICCDKWSSPLDFILTDAELLGIARALVAAGPHARRLATPLEHRLTCCYLGPVCAVCHRAHVDATDHIYSFARGGDSYLLNFAPICVDCNSDKGADFLPNETVWLMHALWSAGLAGKRPVFTYVDDSGKEHLMRLSASTIWESLQRAAHTQEPVLLKVVT